MSVDGKEYISIDDLPEFREFKAEEISGKVIRFYRKMLKLTQAQLAEKVGAASWRAAGWSTTCNWSAGRRRSR